MKWHSVGPLAATVAVLAFPARGQTTACASTNPAGDAAAGDSRDPSLSADGRWLAFLSFAPDILPGPMAPASIFVRDLATGAVTRVSVDSLGNLPNGTSTQPAISADGRWVAFASSATNLVPSDTNGQADVFVHHRASGATVRVSLDSSGVQAGQASSLPSISADGRYIAFMSLAPFVATDTNGKYDVYVRDRVLGTTTRASVSSTGGESTGDCQFPSISGDGRRVAFHANADDLVAGDTNGWTDVFVRDLVSSTTVRASVSSAGVQGDYSSLQAVMSGDGNTVVFASQATNFAGTTGPTYLHAYAHDLASGATSILDVDPSGTAGNGSLLTLGRCFAVSTDGRWVAFPSVASNLVPNDTNHDTDLFVRDRSSGTTARASLGACGQETAGHVPSLVPSISADGRVVAFHTMSWNLIAGDENLDYDVFVRDAAGAPSGSIYCSGDGSWLACPCGNAGLPGRGCAHSADAEGAGLFASGTPSVSADTLRLGAHALPEFTSCLFFQGTATSSSTFGDGLRCAGGTVIRLSTQPSADEFATYPTAGAAPISVAGLIPASGGTRRYQAWFRNAAVFCTTAMFNLTNGVEVAWQP